MRVFVTGATGFIGSHLVESLLSSGEEVACLVRNRAKAERLFGQGPRIVTGDLTTDAGLEAGATDADVVLHVAGLVSARNRREFFAVNERATRRLVEVVRRVAPNLRQFVYVSSLSAAGPTTRGNPIDELAPPRPVSDYGSSKLAGEQATRASGLPWVIVRPATVYGPRDVQLLRMFKLARFGLAPIFGSGAQELSVLHVRDLIGALLSVTQSATTETTYFASHPTIVTTKLLAYEIHAAVYRFRNDTTGEPPPPRFPIHIPQSLSRAGLAASGMAARMLGRRTLLSTDKANEFLAEAWTCSAEALERATGWGAEISLTPGLDDTARWYGQHGWL